MILLQVLLLLRVFQQIVLLEEILQRLFEGFAFKVHYENHLLQPLGL